MRFVPVLLVLLLPLSSGCGVKSVKSPGDAPEQQVDAPAIAVQQAAKPAGAKKAGAKKAGA